MSYRVGIEIVNDSANEIDIIIPVGSVFEVDLRSGVQNIATSKQYRFVIPPYSTLKTLVEGVCLNRDLVSPNGAKGRATPFRYDSEKVDQHEVWETVSQPKGG